MEVLAQARRSCGARHAYVYRWPTGLLGLAGCAGPQSALDPAGRAAERIADLFWYMAAGAGVIWLAVIVLALYAMRARPEAHSPRVGQFLIVGAGAILPTVVLAGLLAYGLALIPDLLRPAPESPVQITVIGEQWWWRVRYHAADGHGAALELANELRLPVGERVALYLESPDVIHSFWIPTLAGKLDMVPGYRNRLTLEPTRVGSFRGVCAEYCGTSHALMSFNVVVLEPEDFAAWLAHQREPARPPTQPLTAYGQELFLMHGCNACHTVRGTPADGVVGPDLTHVGSRLSLGAGILPNDPAAFLHWIAHTADAKPGVHMPAFGMLPLEELQALAAYLDGLQ